MKMQLQLAGLALALNIIQPSTVLAQGSLTPSGAPAASMRTLDQIYARGDARIPITNSAGAVTISAPGSYYLTTNLTVSSGNAITIATNGVTLDLNGYTLSSTVASAAGSGILINSGLRNLTIQNGFIQGGVTNNGSGIYGGSGFGYGINYSGTAPVNVLVSRVAVSGCLNYGIYLNTGDSTVVENCTARTVGNYGICASTIKSCVAVDCYQAAILGNQVSDCRGSSTGSYGVYAFTALNCSGYSSVDSGISATTVQNCYGSGSGSGSGNGNGIVASSVLNCCGYSGSGSGNGIVASTVLNCYGYSSSGSGISASTAQSSFGYSGGSGSGVSVSIAQNCYGQSSSSYGVYVFRTATGCYGYSTSGTGLYALIANVCNGGTSTGTALSVTHNVNSY